MEHGCGAERGRALLLLAKCHLAQLSEAAKGGSGSGGTSVQIAVLRQVTDESCAHVAWKRVVYGRVNLKVSRQCL